MTEVQKLAQRVIVLEQELLDERETWIKAIKVVLDNPNDLAVIGDPVKENDVREALRPVAELTIRLREANVRKQTITFLAQKLVNEICKL